MHLEVTPHASEDGMIFMDVHPTVKNVIGYTGSPAQPVLSVREASTSVVMPDATTLIIGGLLKRDVNKSWQEVPFLSRIPLIGWLFQQKAASDEKDDLDFPGQPAHRDAEVDEGTGQAEQRGAAARRAGCPEEPSVRRTA